MALLRRRGKEGAPGAASRDERELVRAIRAGEEAAFERLVMLYGPSMLRVARLYVKDRAVAQEVVQETWLAVLEGIGRFEARSSLKTWIFRILTNRAKTRGQREGRSIPFSSIAAADAAADEQWGDPDRFVRPDDPRTPYAWSSPPRHWPAERLLEKETLAVIERAIEALPASQREVIRLRDVEGWSAPEVADALELSDGNQRVLLHRARSKVRAALEDYLDGGAP